ncbi:LOW QUALITY PROTEIN: hypothetical protein J0S82_020485, partial [Galemys pyrenaicus]
GQELNGSLKKPVLPVPTVVKATATNPSISEELQKERPLCCWTLSPWFETRQPVSTAGAISCCLLRRPSGCNVVQCIHQHKMRHLGGECDQWHILGKCSQCFSPQNLHSTQHLMVSPVQGPAEAKELTLVPLNKQQQTTLKKKMLKDSDEEEGMDITERKRKFQQERETSPSGFQKGSSRISDSKARKASSKTLSEASSQYFLVAVMSEMKSGTALDSSPQKNLYLRTFELRKEHQEERNKDDQEIMNGLSHKEPLSSRNKYKKSKEY